MSKKILVVGPSWVGDMVMAQSLFKVLKRIHIRSRVDVLAPAWSRPLLERMPEVTESIDMPLGHGQVGIKARYHLGKHLREVAYDQAIVLPNSLKSALVPAWAKIPRRTGWRGEMRYGVLNDVRRLDKQRYPLMVERFVALALPNGNPMLRPIPAPLLEIDPGNAAQALDTFSLNTDRPVLALCPGAEFGRAKQWPAAHYSEVARERIAAGWQVWLFGSANDVPVTEEIRTALAPADRELVQNLAGRTQLADAVDLLSLAACVVSNDSGLMHISAALNRPVVVVYGSTSPDFTPPLAEQVSIQLLGIDCSPCFQRECPLETNRYRCLTDLPPQQIIHALRGLVDED